MGVVHTDKLQEDMVLSKDIKDINGRLLLAKGEKIHANHIRIFKMWGIPEVIVIGDFGSEEDSESHVEPDLYDKISEYTKYIFKHADVSHPAVEELFRLSVIFRGRHNLFESEREISLSKRNDKKNHILKDVYKKIVQRRIKLPEIPSIIFELNEVIANPFASANSIAEVVKKSPSLTALLLRIVNSSFYGFPSQIDSISRAVTIIGTREIADLALGISTITMFKDIPKEIIEMSSFLKHSFFCGIISRILAAHKNIPKTEQLFVAGLLHDIGKLIVYRYFPEQAKFLLMRSAETDRLLYQEELDCLGCKHTDIGRYLLQQWKLPFELENTVFYHHNPSKTSNQIHAAIVHLADIIVNGLGIGSSGERFVPPLDYKAWDILDLSPSIFEMVISQATHQLVTFETFLKR